MAHSHPDPTDSLILAVRSNDVERARQALKWDADINKRQFTTSPSQTGPYDCAAIELLGRIEDPTQWEHWEPMARLLLSRSWGCAPATQARFASGCINKWKQEGFGWALRVGVDESSLKAFFPNVGKQQSLFNVAMLNKEDDLALRLWDEFGVGPTTLESETDLVVSSLSVACGPLAQVFDRPGTLWDRLMAQPWTQWDLDNALHASLGCHRPDVLGQLLERGANPNARHEEAFPPLVRWLSFTPRRPAPGVISVLGSFGARIDDRISFCCGVGGSVSHVHLSDCALKSSAWERVAEHHGVQPLGLACAVSDHDAVRELLELGADVNHSSREGNTPLHFLAMGIWHARQENPAHPHVLIHALLDAGANPVLKNAEGQTPVEMFLAYPSDPDSVSVGATGAAFRWVRATLDAAPCLESRIRSMAQERTKEHPLYEAILGAVEAWGVGKRLEAMPAATSDSTPRPRM